MNKQKLAVIKANTLIEIDYIKKELMRLYDAPLDQHTSIQVIYFKHRMKKEKEKLKLIKELEVTYQKMDNP